ncbi:hypothetical protein DERP_015454, partial [Dermatophagoides pteronyssinus]
DEEFPTEITDKVFYYNDLLERYIRSLKSSDFGFMVPSIRFSNVIPLDVSTRSMDCTKHISIPEEHETESNDDVDFMKEAEEIVGGADLAMNCLSYHPDFGEFMIMNTNDNVVTDFSRIGSRENSK